MAPKAFVEIVEPEVITPAHRYVLQRERDHTLYMKRKARLVGWKGGRCKDCGYKEHLAPLQFDHVKGSKIAEVSVFLMSASWEAAKFEARKCDLVCANCHAIRTAKRVMDRWTRLRKFAPLYMDRWTKLGKFTP